MQKLVWLLNRDKLMHMLAGIVMVDVFVLICALFLQISWAVSVSFVSATTIMAAKEIIYDKLMNKGVCSLKDFIAGEIGILFQTLITLLYVII